MQTVTKLRTICLAAAGAFAVSGMLLVFTSLHKIPSGMQVTPAAKLLTEPKPNNLYLVREIPEYVPPTEPPELVPVDVSQIPHLFFHSLIVDTGLAFDNDEDAAGYNQYMTTKTEFEAMLAQLYENQYMLVSPYDAYTETEEGFVPAELLLPEGKRPLIISQDDVNYYRYMDGDGFAQRLVIAEGRVQCEYRQRSGSVSVGAYDLIPILDEFVAAHPDFSYQGAKAVIAVTGYAGAFGYHNANDPESPDFPEESRKVKEIAAQLRADGYVLASHTYSHIRCGTVSLQKLQDDTDAWNERIASLIGDVDILIYPFGEDITSNVRMNAYDASPRFRILYDAGFRYFMNVDSSVNAWMQGNTHYFRGARRNIDGFRMFYYGDKMGDLFYDVTAIYDPQRPDVAPLF